MEVIEKHLAQVEEGMTLLDVERVQEVIAMIRMVRAADGIVYVFGNGGSHSTASHFVNDLVKTCRVRALSLGDMSPLTFAYGNDNGWETMFSGPLLRMIRPNDMVIGISCGGNSENVIRALKVGAEGVGKAVLTGMSRISDLHKIVPPPVIVYAPVPDIRVQEDLHMMICHAICRTLAEER